MSLFLSPLSSSQTLLFDIKSVSTSCYRKLKTNVWKILAIKKKKKKKLLMVPEPSQPIMLRKIINRKAASVTATDSPCAPGTCFAVHLAGAIMSVKKGMKK